MQATVAPVAISAERVIGPESTATVELDASGNGLGIRSKRYCMVVDDGVVKSLAIEDVPSKADASGAEALLKSL